MKYAGISWLNSLAKWDGVNFSSLEVARRLLKYVDDPQDSFSSIHIAGTNGKGSVAAYINSILVHSKKYPVVGKICSPYLISLEDSAQINSVNISLADLNEELVLLEKACGELNENPTAFVAQLIATFLLFKRNKVDVVVLEAGLGGGEDATNVVSKKLLHVITNISFDHQNILGESLVDIAKHKAGIITTSAPTVLGALGEEVLAVFLERAKSAVSSVELWGRDFQVESNVVSFQDKDIKLSQVNFEPEFKLINQSLAVVASLILGVSEEYIMGGLRLAKLRGRYEKFKDLRGRIRAVVDVAHNEAGVRGLFSESLVHFYKSYSRVCVVCCFLKRKSWKESLAVLLEELKRGQVRFSLRAFCDSSEMVQVESMREYLAELGLEQSLVEDVEDVFKGDEESLVLSLGSVKIYKPFIEWAESQKLLPEI